MAILKMRMFPIHPTPEPEESLLERILSIYWANPLRNQCCWRIGKELIRDIRIMTDGDGRYMWEPENGWRLLGLRLNFCDDPGIRLVNDDLSICPHCGRTDNPYPSGNCRGCGYRRENRGEEV